MRRPFLVPVSLALAALGPQAAGAATADAIPGAAAVQGSRARITEAFRHPLLAIAQSRQGLAGALGHSSHSSHASHASHASHFSSSGGSPLPPAPAPVPTPTPTLTTTTTPSPAAATTTYFSASLTVSQAVPTPAVTGNGANGSFTATLTGRLLHWNLTSSNLSGDPVAAVIHLGAQGKNGARLLPLCGKCTSSASGTVVLSPGQVAALIGKATYINVGTHLNPAGEIRGQIRRA
jgi:hypothetical protein